MLGGFLWCTGNMTTVPIIQCIGLGVGLFLWSTVSLFLGWLTGTLGLFHITPTVVNIPWLNYLGAVLAILSGIAFALIKPNPPEEKEEEKAFITSINEAPVEDHKSVFQKLSPTYQRILGVVLSLIGGCCYGTNMTPPQYIMNTCKTCSQNGLDYIFPHFCGIMLTSTGYFLIYCMVMKNKPWISSELTLPAWISGAMWGVAQCMAFIANSAKDVGFVISFPIFSTIPGIIASLWGIIIFKEISGMRNYLAFAGAFLIVASSVICVTLSQNLGTPPAPGPQPADYVFQ